MGALLSVLGMGGLVLGILAWQEGGESVGALLATGVIAMGALAYWLVRRKRAGKPTLIDPDLFSSKLFRFGISEQMLQQIALGGVMIALPIYLQMVLEYNALQAGLSLAPLSLSMFAVAVLAGKKAGQRRPASIIRLGFVLLTVGVAVLIPIVPRAEFGWALLVPLLIAGSGLGLLVSQLNNYTLSPISEERVSEAAGVNSAAGSFGLSFGLAFAGAIMLAALSLTFTKMADASTVLPAGGEATGRPGTGGERGTDDQHSARRAAGQPTPRDPGRDHPHQHRSTTHFSSGGTAHSAPRRPHRTVQLIPHDAPARPHTIRLRRDGPRLISHPDLNQPEGAADSYADVERIFFGLLNRRAGAAGAPEPSQGGLLGLRSLWASSTGAADSITDLDLRRHGGMGRLFTGIRAPSTSGGFLRLLSFGHVRQLDAVEA